MPDALCTHDDCRRATTADLLALLLHPPVIGLDAVATLNKILGETLRNKPGRQLHAAIELARRQMLAIVNGHACIDVIQNDGGIHADAFSGAGNGSLCGDFPRQSTSWLAVEDLFFCTIDAASVYPREIVRNELLRNAAAVVLARNHPSGVSEPSIAGVAPTKNIQRALTLLGIRLLDHVVLGQGIIEHRREITGGPR